MSYSETSRFEMSSSAVVPASTTDTGDVAAVDQGLPIQNLCEVCETIFATEPFSGEKPPLEKMLLRRRRNRPTPIDFQAAASGGCGICKLVVRSRTYKDRNWCTKKPLIVVSFDKLSGKSLLVFEEAMGFYYSCPPTVILRLLEPQGINPKLFGTLVLICGSNMTTETSSLKPRWLPTCSLGTKSLESFNKLNHWLTTCIYSHAGCTKPNMQPNVLPVRMLEIDLDGCEPIERIRLQCGVLPTRYATLSHCWGPDLRIIPQLLQKNLADRLQEIILDTLPRTFTDAVICAYRLGIRYLWIDCLCIIQDSKEDWLQQSAIMAEIYSSAFVNFAATASSSCEGGLFRSRSDPAVNPCIVDPHFARKSRFLYHCVDEEVLWQDVKDGVLNTRGWTFQETLLAPRTLHFTDTQIYWQCESLCASEVYVDGLLDTPPKNGKSQLTSTGKQWWTIVEKYTSRSLTHETEDKLVALSGVARRVAMNDHLKDNEYLAGIWRHDLPFGLFWRSTSGGFPLHNGVPSWSWASISGKVESGLDPWYGQGVAFDFVAAYVTPKADPYGQVRGGSVRISAHSFGKFDLSKSFDTSQGYYFRISGVPHYSMRYLSCWLDIRDFRELSNLSNIYYCFWPLYVSENGGIGLLLEKVDTGKFKRTGFFNSYEASFVYYAGHQRPDTDDYEYLNEAGQYTFSII